MYSVKTNLNLGPLPNDVILTMKLHYYNAVTPHDYQPPGFKEGVNSHFLLFEGEPVNLQVGLVSTGFHSMKVKVTTEATRVSDLENNLFQESSTTEIAHQGLDCDEEEEECDNHHLQDRPSFLVGGVWTEGLGREETQTQQQLTVLCEAGPVFSVIISWTDSS
ncbi:HORMA domain containing 2-like protein [Camelus ferus]|nr:HORMA domain containing 2-like protein [Camelus ferus]